MHKGSRLRVAGGVAAMVLAAAILAAGVAMPAGASLLGKAIGNAINGHGDGPVWIERADAYKGVDHVVIGQFTVVFLTKKVDFAGGGFFSAGESAKAIGQLSGPTGADYQRITDAIYADFQAKLAAGGVKVVDPAAYYASKDYQSLKSEDQGRAVSILLQDQDKADGTAWWPGSMAHRDNIVLAMGFMDTHMGISMAQLNYARASGTPVLNVAYVVDFAEPAKSSGGGMFQSVKVSAEIAVSHRGSQFVLMDGTGRPARIALNKPLVESGTFAQISDITSGLTKTAESAQLIGNVLGAIGGHGSSMFGRSRMDRRFDFHVTDTAGWGTMATHAGGQANDLLIGQMGGLR